MFSFVVDASQFDQSTQTYLPHSFARAVLAPIETSVLDCLDTGRVLTEAEVAELRAHFEGIAGRPLGCQV